MPLVTAPLRDCTPFVVVKTMMLTSVCIPCSTFIPLYSSIPGCSFPLAWQLGHDYCTALSPSAYARSASPQYHRQKLRGPLTLHIHLGAALLAPRPTCKQPSKGVSLIGRCRVIVRTCESACESECMCVCAYARACLRVHACAHGCPMSRRAPEAVRIMHAHPTGCLLGAPCVDLKVRTRPAVLHHPRHLDHRRCTCI